MSIKRITAAFSAAAMLAAAIPAQTIAAEDYSDMNFASWRSAYYFVLRDCMKSKDYNFDKNDADSSRYELFDIDEDNTPELFVSSGTSRAGKCTVYSYYGGKLSEPVELGTYGVAYANSGAHYLVHNDTYIGVKTLDYYKLENGEFTKEISFLDNELNKGKEGIELTYRVNGTEVSETEYSKERKKYDKYELSPHGRTDCPEEMIVVKDDVCYNFMFDEYMAINHTVQSKKPYDLVIADEINGIPVRSVSSGFKNDDMLRSVTFGKNVRYIDEKAFENDKNLTTVKFLGNPEVVAPNTFKGCTSLEEFTGIEGNGYYRIEDGVLYYSIFPKLAIYPAGKKDKDFTVPYKITRIASYAFVSNPYIQNIVCGENVILIGEGAFSECPALESVTIYNGEAEIVNKYTDLTVSNSYDEKAGKTAYTGVIRGYEKSTAETWCKHRNASFEPLGGTYIRLAGDVNDNMKIDAVDASLILMEYAAASSEKGGTFTVAQRRAADVDKNDSVNAVDASKVLAYYAHVSIGGNDTLEEFLGLAK